MNYQEYIKSELLVLIPVMYFIGIGLKKSKISNKWIPLLLGCISVILSSIWVISSSQIKSFMDLAAATFTAVTQGVLAAGTSVYINQLYVQSKKSNDQANVDDTKK